MFENGGVNARCIVMEKLQDFEFYDDGEPIPLPKSFQHIATKDDGTEIYGNHTYGREIKWEYVPYC